MEVTAFQSTVDRLLTQKLQMLDVAAAADENDSAISSKLTRLCLMSTLIRTRFLL